MCIYLIDEMCQSVNSVVNECVSICVSSLVYTSIDEDYNIGP